MELPQPSAVSMRLEMVVEGWGAPAMTTQRIGRARDRRHPR
jgi:hypothetical protein